MEPQTKIKLAILCPIRRRIAPGVEGTVENHIALLAGELVKLGVEVTLLAAAGSQSPGGLAAIAAKPLEDHPAMDPAAAEAMALAKALPRLKEFDLVHSFFGPAALAITSSILIPMVDAMAPAAECLHIYREVLAGRENHRPWGHYENLAEGPDHKIKRIYVSPGARLSLQKHKRRAERWTVISGQAIVTLDGKDIPLAPGETIFIPKGAAHRMTNPGKVPLVFAEVQLGDYFGEDDIIRLQDDYGRGA
jgi:mannose-6-phosphate isomerase-like protein (cupin superfamily)